MMAWNSCDEYLANNLSPYWGGFHFFAGDLLWSESKLRATQDFQQLRSHCRRDAGPSMRSLLRMHLHFNTLAKANIIFILTITPSQKCTSLVFLWFSWTQCSKHSAFGEFLSLSTGSCPSDTISGLDQGLIWGPAKWHFWEFLQGRHWSGLLCQETGGIKRRLRENEVFPQRGGKRARFPPSSIWGGGARCTSISPSEPTWLRKAHWQIWECGGQLPHFQMQAGTPGFVAQIQDQVFSGCFFFWEKLGGPRGSMMTNETFLSYHELPKGQQHAPWPSHTPCPHTANCMHVLLVLIRTVTTHARNIPNFTFTHPELHSTISCLIFLGGRKMMQLTSSDGGWGCDRNLVFKSLCD